LLLAFNVILDSKFKKAMSLQVIFEDNHLIAVNKPAGMLVHADATEDATLEDFVKEYIKIRYRKPGDVFLGTIHRIDRPVSGAIVFARTSKALTRMNELFKKREIEKKYWAITQERPSAISGTLEHYIAKDRSKNQALIYDQLSTRAKNNKAKKARLSYQLIAGADNRNVLEISLETGRPHQIRVQLAHSGTPIVGDLKYGAPFPMNDATIALHSRSISFLHPVRKEPVTITADPPLNEEWSRFAEVLNF
jgi:23S rRNA pseudouridine1911/1915/1917 synthase